MADNDNENKQLQQGFRRLITSEANRRHLRAMPAFRVSDDLADFDDLLGQLDRAQSRREQRNH